MNTRVWTDTLLSHTEQQQQLLEGDQQQATTAGSSSSSRLGSWDYSMPGLSLKARSRIKNTSSRDNKLKEHHQQRVRFNARHPFHRRQKGGSALATAATVGGDSEELGWTLDQDGLTSAAAAGRLPAAVSGANSGSAASGTAAGRGGSDGHPLPSPASVGPFTPRPGPDSVRNAAGDSAIAHPSPAPPLSNGPPTPFDALLMHPKTPGTPAGGGGDQGGPRSQAPSSVPPPSPYHHHHRPGSRSGFSSVTGPAGDVKVEAGESGVNKTEEPPPPPTTAYEGPAASAAAGTNERLAAGGKRPALPAKEYEEEEEEQGERRPQSVYDYTLLHAWLSHPVKKFKGECPSRTLCT